MWILIQNGKRILSTEGMEEINVSDPAEGRTDFAVMMRRKHDGRPFALGFYEKKERAEKVLKEIFEAQARYYTCEGGSNLITGGYQPAFIAIPPKVYTVPPDNDAAFTKEIVVGKGKKEGTAHGRSGAVAK